VGLDVGDQPHRRLEEQSVGGTVGIPADASARRVLGGVGDAGGGQRGGVGDTGMTASLVDERGACFGRLVQLQTVRRPLLGQLRRPIAHALLPLACRKASSVSAKTLLDVGDAHGATEVCPESGQAVIDDMSMGVVETRKNMSLSEIDDPSPRGPQAHGFAAARGNHNAAGDRQVRVRGEAAAPKGPDAAPRQDQIRLHVADKVRKWPS
jgi:hypothetical protein